MNRPRIYSQNSLSSTHQNDVTQRVNEKSSDSELHHGTTHGHSGPVLYNACVYSHVRTPLDQSINRRLPLRRRRAGLSSQNHEDGDTEDVAEKEQHKFQQMGMDNMDGLSNHQRSASLQRKKRLLRKTAGMGEGEGNGEGEASDTDWSALEHRQTQNIATAMDESRPRAEQMATDQSNGNDQAEQSDPQQEEMRIPTAQHVRLRLARPKPSATLALQAKRIDGMSPDQCAAYVLHSLTEELLRVRDQFTQNPARASLRPSVQALMLNLLCLRYCKKLFTPTDLANVRQTLMDVMDAAKQHKEQNSNQQEQEQEKGEKQQDGKPRVLPPQVENLNLLMPLLLLNSARPSTTRQLKRAIGRTKVIIRTALTATDGLKTA